jgi:hypothetical protein
MSHYTLRGLPDIAAQFVVAAVTGYFHSIACAANSKGVDGSLQVSSYFYYCCNMKPSTHTYIHIYTYIPIPSICAAQLNFGKVSNLLLYFLTQTQSSLLFKGL